MITFPLALLVLAVLLPNARADSRLALLYGFATFFGWITAIILGMTFKTLPFIIWNKVYGKRAGTGKTANPRDLHSEKIFKVMIAAWMAGFGVLSLGLGARSRLLLQGGSALLILAALLYNWNVIKLITHKADI
jgi:hypothetical protein